MRPLIIILALFLFFPVNASFAHASSANQQLQPIISEQLSNLDLKDLQGFLEKIDQELQEEIAGFSMRELLEAVKQGDLNLDLESFFKMLLGCFFREILAHSSLLGKLLVLGAVLGILEHLQGAFEESTVASVAHGVGFLALFTVAISSFTFILQTGQIAINNMVDFMHALLPVLLTLMAALGNVTSVALIHPLILVALNILGALTGKIVFPLIFFSAVLGVVSQVSDRIQVSRLAGLFRDSSILLLSFFSTIFTGVLAVQGVAGAVSDGIGLRTAKFLTGAFVPVVGNLMTDAVEVIAGCSLFIKNAIGIIGALGVLIICIIPVMKILAVALVYKLAAALMQPLGTQKLSDCLQLLGNHLLIVFGAVAAVGLMFFLTMTIIVGFGNMVVMLR